MVEKKSIFYVEGNVYRCRLPNDGISVEGMQIVLIYASFDLRRKVVAMQMSS